jgi:imidazolonepropionase-like amidohydrolase
VDVRQQFGIERMDKATSLAEDVTRFTKMAFDAGFPILAGTDNLSLFDELEHYEDAGIPRADVLRAATRNGAEWLRRGDDFGTVEVGMRGHLILVDGDPLAQMSDLRNIEVVVKDGRVVVVR